MALEGRRTVDHIPVRERMVAERRHVNNNGGDGRE
jgi:hypothetical protein